ncbi:hypothetical protein BD560DRAFT_381865, partial [Blakeslea trispora]
MPKKLCFTRGSSFTRILLLVFTARDSLSTMKSGTGNAPSLFTVCDTFGFDSFVFCFFGFVYSRTIWLDGRVSGGSTSLEGIAVFFNSETD